MKGMKPLGTLFFVHLATCLIGPECFSHGTRNAIAINIQEKEKENKKKERKDCIGGFHMVIISYLQMCKLNNQIYQE